MLSFPPLFDMFAIVALGLITALVFRMPVVKFGFRFIMFVLCVMAILQMVSTTGMFTSGFSPSEYDLAKRQALLRMRFADSGNNLQPYGCDNTVPTDSPTDPVLKDIAQALNVSIVVCPGSSWSIGQPGIIMTWHDFYGIHVYYIFGAQYLLYRDNYETLGRPTGNPYRLESNPDIMVQNFGIHQRIFYDQYGMASGRAWIQTRSYILSFDPMCIPTLLEEASCWWPMTALANSYTPSSGLGAGSDWLENRVVPMDGLYAPLTPWKTFILSMGLIAFYAIFTAVQRGVLSAGRMWGNSRSGCFGMLMYLISLISAPLMGAFVMILGLIFAFADPRIEAGTLASSADNFYLPDNFTRFLYEPAVDWLVGWYSMASAPSLINFMLYVIIAMVLGSLVPIWMGLFIGGTFGGYIGAVVGIGLLMDTPIIHRNR